MRPVLAAALLAATPAFADGAAVFDANCAFCHQGGGVGVPGQFPRLAGRAGAIAAKPNIRISRCTRLRFTECPWVLSQITIFRLP